MIPAPSPAETRAPATAKSAEHFDCPFTTATKPSAQSLLTIQPAARMARKLVIKVERVKVDVSMVNYQR